MVDEVEEQEPGITVEDQIDRAWVLTGANQAPTPEEIEAAQAKLTDYDFMPVSELEEIVGLENKGSPEYAGASKALARRPKTEYQPGSGDNFYRGNNDSGRPGSASGR